MCVVQWNFGHLQDPQWVALFNETQESGPINKVALLYYFRMYVENLRHSVLMTKSLAT